jgi:DNA-binding response OmpR family regulator
MRILMVEDDPKLARPISDALLGERYVVDLARDGASGLARALTLLYDVIVVERGLPDFDGIDLVRQIRQARVITPVLMLAALSSTEDQVAGLDAGADDYLARPFALIELQARVRALARRPRRPDLMPDPTARPLADVRAQ